MKKILLLHLVLLSIIPSYAQENWNEGLVQWTEEGITTNFIVPITRFSFLKQTADDQAVGRLLLFNSVGAGVSFQKMKLQKFNIGYDISENWVTNMVYRYGVQLGVLFSTRDSGEEIESRFAPTFGITILDFHIGYGYEMGSRSAKESPHFIAISYGISLSNLNTISPNKSYKSTHTSVQMTRLMRRESKKKRRARHCSGQKVNKC